MKSVSLNQRLSRWTDGGNMEYFNKAKKFLKIPVVIISIVLLCAVFLIMQINAYFYGSTYENYLISLAASFAELIITLSFVQYALDSKRNADAKNEELERIKKFHRVLRIYIQHYTLYYNQMTVPLGKERSEISLIHFRKNFKVSDLADLYKPTLLMKDSFQVSPVEKFFTVEKKLSDTFSQILINQDFKFYPNLNVIFQNFIERSLSNNPSGAILGNIKMRLGNEDAKIKISKMLKSDGDEYYKKLIVGENTHSHLLFAYCLLYEFMQSEAVVIEQYNEYIQKILPENEI